MTKLFSISKNGKHLGSILADKIICDPLDNYLLFMRGSETIAYFPVENIEIEQEKFSITKAKSDFVEYQSNRI